MKKIRQAVLFSILCLILIFSINSTAAAEDGLKITSWTVGSVLNRDGSLSITEDISFKFSSKYNGVFREIYLKDTSGVADISVSQINGGTETSFKRVEDAANGDSAVYQVIKNNTYDQVKIYSPSNNEEKTFRLRYRVLNVAVKYRDTGELYYNYIGAENKTKIEKFAITLQLPEAGRDIKAFWHGPEGGILEQSGNLIKARASAVDSGQPAAIRTVFPAEYVGLSSRFVDTDGYNRIISEENTYSHQLQQDAAQKTQLRKLADFGVIVLIICAAAAFLFVSMKLRRKDKYNPDNFYDILPEDCTPAVMKRLYSNFTGTGDILATLLDLSRKGYIKLENTEGNFGRNNKYSDFAITKDKPADIELLDHERFLIAWLIEKIGDGSTVWLSDIQENSKKNIKGFTANFNQWKTLVKNEAQKRGYFHEAGKKYGVGTVVFSAVMFVLSFVFIVLGSNYGVICTFLSIAMFIYGMRTIYRRSDYGEILYHRWRKFRKYYKENEDSYIMEAYLPYALALGMDKNTFIRYKNKYTQQQYNNANYFWLYWYFAMSTDSNSNAFNDSFNSAFGSSGSSDSGSSSSSGGAGGGGAGGF